MSGAPRIFDRELLIARRDRAARAQSGGRPDFLLARVADDFAERLAAVHRDFLVAANIGAYDGLLAERLEASPSVGRIINVEASLVCLQDCARPKVGADEEALPFAAQSLDLAVSALSLHLVNDLPGTLVQINRALKPDGLLLAALLGGETLGELRQSWLSAEAEILGGASPRVAPFADVRELGGLLQRAGFALPVADSDTVEVTYPSALALMQEIKAMGASNMLCERRRAPVTRRLLFRAAEIYEQQFALPGGRIPATFEIVTLTGWVPHESQQKPLRPGSADISLSKVLPPRQENREAKE